MIHFNFDDLINGEEFPWKRICLGAGGPALNEVRDAPRVFVSQQESGFRLGGRRI